MQSIAINTRNAILELMATQKIPFNTVMLPTSALIETRDFEKDFEFCIITLGLSEMSQVTVRRLRTIRAPT